jgi:hypothetical protein
MYLDQCGAKSNSLAFSYPDVRDGRRVSFTCKITSGLSKHIAKSV